MSASCDDAVFMSMIVRIISFDKNDDFFNSINECINTSCVRLNPMVLSRDEVSQVFCVWIIFVEV